MKGLNIIIPHTEEEKMIEIFKFFKITSYVLSTVLFVTLIFSMIFSFIDIVIPIINGQEVIMEEGSIYEIISNMYNDGEKYTSNIQLIFDMGEILVAIFSLGVVFSELAKVFKNIEMEKTPFVKDNLKRMDSIEYLAFISAILYGKGFIICVLLVGIIVAFNYMMKFGYKLQQQADETL